MQEVITLAVFAVFSVRSWASRCAGTSSPPMACLVAAVVFIFLPVE